MVPVNSARGSAAAWIFRPLIDGVARLCTFSSTTASRTAQTAMSSSCCSVHIPGKMS